MTGQRVELILCPQDINIGSHTTNIIIYIYLYILLSLLLLLLILLILLLLCFLSASLGGPKVYKYPQRFLSNGDPSYKYLSKRIIFFSLSKVWYKNMKTDPPKTTDRASKRWRVEAAAAAAGRRWEVQWHKTLRGIICSTSKAEFQRKLHIFFLNMWPLLEWIQQTANDNRHKNDKLSDEASTATGLTAARIIIQSLASVSDPLGLPLHTWDTCT